MFSKKRQMKDEAASLLRSGKYEKALKLFRNLSAQDPDDYSARRNLGYILRKLGRKAEAVRVFEQLANEYADDGFLLKAIATCKVVLEMNPGQTAIQERLADLYSRRTSTPTPDIKVMADVDTDGMVFAGSVLSQEVNLEGRDLEEPEDGGTFEIQSSTSSEDIFGMVELADIDTNAGKKEKEDKVEEIYETDYIEMIELEPIKLEPIPLEKGESFSNGVLQSDDFLHSAQIEQAPSSPVVGTLVTPRDETMRESTEDDSGGGTEETANLSDSGPILEPVPADELDLETKTEVHRQVNDSAQGVMSEDNDFDIDIDIEISMDAGHAKPKQAAKAPEIPLFCELQPDAFVSLLEKMKLIRMTKGQLILKEGQEGRSMFTVASGKVRVLKRIAPRRQLQLAVLGEGTFFGEMAMLRGGTRGASVQCVESGELFEVSKQLMDEVVRTHPAVERVIEKFSHQRLLRNIMATSPIFKPFGKKERVKIVENFVSRQVQAGDILVREGEESDGLYLVLRGRMEVFCRTEDSKDIQLGHLGEGDLFGEISCLRKEPAIATVRALTNGSVLRLPRKKFDTLIISHPQVLILMSELSDERLAKTSNLLAEKGILI